MSEPHVRAHLFEGFEAFCAARRLAFPALLDAGQLNADMIADPGAEIPLNAAASVLSMAADTCGDQCLGLHWAEAFPRGAAGVLGYLLGNATSVREGVRTINRYVSLHLDPIEVQFIEHDEGGARLEWRFPVSFTAPRMQYASFVMALLVINLRRYIGDGWYPKGVELEHRALPCAADVARIFGPNVKFDCPANALNLRESVLNRESLQADHHLFVLLRDLGDRLLAERRSSVDFVEATRRTIVRELENGRTTLEAIAEVMTIPPRALQTKLLAAGETFEDLLQDTRRSIAETMLRDSDLTLTDIALLLGFSELSAFTRAATRWFGMAPRNFRSETRRGAPPPSLVQ